MIVTGTEGLSAVLGLCLVCLGVLFTIETATKGWIWGCKFNRVGRGVGLLCEAPALSRGL